MLVQLDGEEVVWLKLTAKPFLHTTDAEHPVIGRVRLHPDRTAQHVVLTDLGGIDVAVEARKRLDVGRGEGSAINKVVEAERQTGRGLSAVGNDDARDLIDDAVEPQARSRIGEVEVELALEQIAQLPARSNGPVEVVREVLRLSRKVTQPLGQHG
jgi:hypothetical protein